MDRIICIISSRRVVPPLLRTGCLTEPSRLVPHLKLRVSEFGPLGPIWVPVRSPSNSAVCDPRSQTKEMVELVQPEPKVSTTERQNSRSNKKGPSSLRHGSLQARASGSYYRRDPFLGKGDPKKTEDGTLESGQRRSPPRRRRTVKQRGM